ncbi:hypothetical protein ACWIB8_03715 [Corynebacterium flavescens]
MRTSKSREAAECGDDPEVADADNPRHPHREARPLTGRAQNWRTRAGVILGADAIRWVRTVTATLDATSSLLRADDVPLDLIAEVGQVVVWEVGEKRTT